MTLKTYNKWMGRIGDKQTPWSEQEIIYFRKAIAHDQKLGQQLLKTFRNFIGLHGYSITQEQSEKGLAYIQKLAFTPTGKLRRGPFTAEEAEIIKNFSHFRFVGLQECTWSFDRYLFTNAIYRVVATDGQAFEYLGVTKERLETISLIFNEKELANE